MINKITKYPLIISGLLALMIFVRVICFVGLIGSDDLNYNRSAYEIVQGTFTPQLDHQRTRLGLFLPVAGAFKLFGVNEWSSILFPFSCSLLTFVVLVSLAINFFGKWTGLMAGLLYTFLPVEIFNATMLLADLPAATCIVLSSSILYLVDKEVSNTHLHHSKTPVKATWKTCGSLFLAGLFLGWAYLSRETALFFGVFAAGYMGYKAFVQKTIRWDWLWFWFGFLMIIGAEFGYYYWMTGNPFYRYTTIESGHNLSILALRDRVHGLSLLRRLALDQLRVLLYIPQFNFYYFFIFAGIIYAIKKRIAYLGYFIGWFLTIFLLFNFSSTSFSEYYPIRSIPRYFTALTFPGLIIMSWYLQEMTNFFLVERREEIIPFRLSLVIPFMLVLVINVVWFSVTVTLLLLAISLLILVSFSESLRTWFRLRISPKYRRIVLPLLLLYVSILPGIYMTAQQEKPGQKITCERSVRSLLGFPLMHPVYTDSRTEAILEFFYEYQYDEKIKSFDEEDGENGDHWKDAYVVVVWERLFFLNRVYNNAIPDFLYHPPSRWKQIARTYDEVNPCIIYEIP